MSDSKPEPRLCPTPGFCPECNHRKTDRRIPIGPSSCSQRTVGGSNCPCSSEHRSPPQSSDSTTLADQLDQWAETRDAEAAAAPSDFDDEKLARTQLLRDVGACLRSLSAKPTPERERRLLAAADNLSRAIDRDYMRDHLLARSVADLGPTFAAGRTKDEPDSPIDMVLHCPNCGKQHVDAPDDAARWANPPHKSHLCHGCSTIWRPADVPTNGVAQIITRGEDDTWSSGTTVGA